MPIDLNVKILNFRFRDAINLREKCIELCSSSCILQTDEEPIVSLLEFKC